jgi:hypothetical protein
MGQIGRIRRIEFLGLVFLAGFFLLGRTARAEGPVSISVSPLYYDLEISPGEEKTGTIFVGNGSEQALDVSAEFSDFFIDDAGNYIFPEGRNVRNENLRPYLMENWLSVDKPEFRLDKGQNESVQYKVSVPSDANLGGHYGVIFFKTRCSLEEDKNVVYTDKSAICLSGRAGVLFLVQVGGGAVKKGEIKKLTLPRISFSDKSSLSVEIANVGNTHFKPEGSVVVKDLFGREQGRMEIKDKTLLPTLSRTFSAELSRKDFFGVYKVSGGIRDGDGREMRFSKRVFLVPWKELLAILALAGVWWWFLKKFKISRRKNEKQKQ